MRKNTVRQALASGQVVIGAFTGFPALGLVEILGYAGCDFVVLDAEHGPITMETIEGLICAAEAVGTMPVVRVPGPDPGMILRALDLGAMEIHVPQVNTAADARQAVEAARYHPLGQRGLHGMIRAARFGLTPTPDYLEWANREPLIIIAIESVEGVRNLPEILAVPGIDVIFMGPADLSHSLGIPAQFSHPKLVETMEGIVGQARAAGLPVGTFAGAPEAARYWADRGVQYLTFEIGGLIAQTVRDVVRSLRPQKAG
jgi:4-hydroxy-2-oxoheptanedioate aldolase